MNEPFIVYGANGYTGQLVARLACARGLRPILASRREGPVSNLAAELTLPYRVFGVEEPRLEGVRAVLNCAGPFSKTALPMMRQAIRAGIHYLDITGEISVFESAHALSEQALAQNVALIPGVGFDVVPTDCIAALLKEELPDATHLELAILSFASLSVGTVKTMIENIPSGGKERIQSKLLAFPLFHKTKRIDFVTKSTICASIPWGDLATAYYSTKIPNIVVYASHPTGMVWFSRIVSPWRGLVGKPMVQKVLGKLADRYIHGPDEKTRENARVELWGRVAGPSGEREMRATVPEGYRFTSELALESVKRVLSGGLAGYYTPAQAFGSGYLSKMPGVQIFRHGHPTKD